MATEALKKFAEELKSTRESKEISLQQIANKTKIDIKFLNAIENANFEILPDIYIKAFIKEYALQIGLSSYETIQKFESARTGRTEQPEQAKVIQPIKEQQAPAKASAPAFDSTEQSATLDLTDKNEQSKKINPNYVYTGVIVLLVMILFYVIFINGSSNEIVQDTPQEEQAAQSGSRFEMENQNPAQANPAGQVADTVAKSDSLRIHLQTSARVWVKVTADGKILHQQVVQPETNLNYSASQYFSVSVGNAGVVKLFFNNKPVANLGKAGEIRNVFLSADTIRYLTIAPQPKNEKKSPTAN